MKKFKAIILSLLLILIVSLVYFISYNVAEPKAYDFMVKNVLTQKFPFDKSKNVYGHNDIVLVVVDEKTVNKYRWPWKRELYCKIYDYFSKYTDAKIIIHDALVIADDIENPDSDRKFFSSIKKMKNLIVGFLPQVTYWKDIKNGLEYDALFAEKYAISVVNKNPPKYHLFNSMYMFPKGYFNSAKYTGSVAMLPGHINGNLDSWSMDTIFRNHEYLFKYYNGKYYPSLALRAFLLINNNPEIELNDKYMSFNSLDLKVKHKKTLYQYIVPLKYYKLHPSGYSHLNYSAMDIIDSYDSIQKGQKPILDAKIFDNKLRLLGANVPAGSGLNDNKSSPLRTNHPGVDYQATALDNLIHNDFLFVLPEYINILLTLLGMFLMVALIKDANLTRAILNTISFLLFYLFACVMCFYFSIVINVITPLTLFILTVIGAYSYKYFIENKNKEKVKNAMGKYISEDVMKNVMKNIDNLGLGGKKATVTVLFSDIRGFTSLSEKMSAQQVSEFLNEYFTEMEPIITQYNGIINKFIGDAIMAVFGEPIQDENHAENAVKCAYAMLKRVKKLHAKWAREGKPEINIGVGINTGEVFVGNIGSVNRMEYTVIGDTVNLASRLENYNKVYKTEILISKSTYKHVVKIADVIKIPDVQIRGKANKIDIYEVLKVKLN